MQKFWSGLRGPSWRKRGAQEGARRAKRPRQGRQDPLSFRKAPRDGQRKLQKAPKAFPEGPLILKIIGFTMVKRTFFISPCHLLLTSPTCPKSLQDLPKTVGRGAQGVQDSGRTAPRGAQEAVKKNKTGPRGPPGAPKAAQDPPKRRPGSAHETTESRRMAGWARNPIRRPFLDHVSTIFGPFLDDFSSIFQ